MTYEKYNKAVELNAEMDYLSNLECLLENACKGKLLATISDFEYDSVLCISIGKCKVLNHSSLTDDIRSKLLQVVREEHNKLSEEFMKL